jgi:hypothetical protein
MQSCLARAWRLVGTAPGTDESISREQLVDDKGFHFRSPLSRNRQLSEQGGSGRQIRWHEMVELYNRYNLNRTWSTAITGQAGEQPGPLASLNTEICDTEV